MFELSKSSTPPASPLFEDSSGVEMSKLNAERELSVRRSCGFCCQIVGILRRGRCLADVQTQETADQEGKLSGVCKTADGKGRRLSRKVKGRLPSGRPASRSLSLTQRHAGSQQQLLVFSQKRYLRDLILRAWILADTGDDGSTCLLWPSEFPICL